MSELLTLTQMKTDDVTSSALRFMEKQRSVTLDGADAAIDMMSYVQTHSQAAQELLRKVKFSGRDGFYVPLSGMNVEDFDRAAVVLPGYFVLIPSSMVGHSANCFYPAVVSKDSSKVSQYEESALRLHVIRQPFNISKSVGYGASILLSAAGQSETPHVGVHRRTSSDSVEAEHFAALLTAGVNDSIQAAWRAGIHSNHSWRGARNNSVTTQVNRQFFGADIPQQTISITKQQFVDRKAMLLWHDTLADALTGLPETATQDNALVIFQALGFNALSERSPRGIDVIRSLLA